MVVFLFIHIIWKKLLKIFFKKRSKQELGDLFLLTLRKYTLLL